MHRFLLGFGQTSAALLWYLSSCGTDPMAMPSPCPTPMWLERWIDGIGYNE